MSTLERDITLLRRVRSARRRRDKADAELRLAIETARAAGETLASIAEAAGVSRQRVHYMLKEAAR